MSTENNKEFKKQLSLEEMGEFIETFNRKFGSFKTRAPVFFTFQVTPLIINLQIENNLTVHHFKINYDQSVEEIISQMKNFLRKEAYPKLEKEEIVLVDPDIHEINELLSNEGITFSAAFNRLSRKKVKKEFIIDKMDINKNKLIVIEKEDYNKSQIYQIKIPVLVFLKKIKGMSSTEAYFEFIKYARAITK